MENESFTSIIGSTSAPYETALSHQCGVADDYFAVSHPSLPNYLAATSGSTFGITDDGEPDVHPIGSQSLFSEVDAAHESWRSYAESMPSNCDTVTSGLYAARHNPAVYYVLLRGACLHDDVPLGPITGGAFAVAARSGALPNFSFVTPNICDDAHSCPVNVGDSWLSRFLPVISDGPQYRAGSVAVFVVYDEGSADNRVPLLVVAPSVPRGTVDRARLDHYSLLVTTERLLGVPALRAARGAVSMTSAFNL
jgi:phospholipase C